MNRLFYSVLHFCVWNHLFLCERSQFVTIMCKYCTKLYIKNKNISDYINNELYIQIKDFPIEISQGIIAAKRINLFAHTNIHGKKK